jgi:hypothetical protein
MEEMRNPCKSLVGNLKGRDHVEGLDLDERIMLKRVAGK